MSFLFILNKWLILRCGQELLKISLENRVVPESRKVLKDQKDGACITFNPYVSELWQFLKILLVFDVLDSFEKYWSGILQTATQLGLSDVFLMGMGLGEEDYGDEVLLSPQQIRRPQYGHNFPLVTLVLIIRLRLCLLLLHRRAPLPLSRLHCTLGSESRSAAHIQWEGF